jgi:hypothetical protein
LHSPQVNRQTGWAVTPTVLLREKSCGGSSIGVISAA